MRNLYLLLFLLYTNASSAQADKPDGSRGLLVAEGHIRLRCGGVRNDRDKQPIVVIDGKIAEFDSINTFSPNNIERIDIIKSSCGQALFGTKGSYGIILITTKSNRSPPLSIRDAENGDPIPGATFTFVRLPDEKDSLRLMGDEFGRVETDVFKPGEKYKLSITSVGYKPFDATFISSKEKMFTTYRLTREIKENEEIVVVGYGATRCRHFTDCRSKVSKCNQLSTDTILSGRQAKPYSSGQSMKFFPNPANRGSFVTIEMRDLAASPLHIKIISLSGAILSTLSCNPLKGSNRIEIPVASHWAAGVYFIQVTSEKGELLKQNKLIIQ